MALRSSLRASSRLLFANSSSNSRSISSLISSNNRIGASLSPIATANASSFAATRSHLTMSKLHMSSEANGGGAQLRNVAIIAHVDHGKTTLVDKLLDHCGENVGSERVMDSMDLERERGVTIRSKVTAVEWKDARVNIVDTPGHADFGGEVERVLGMVEGVILLVDATEGPMPQTKFVLSKALQCGLHPIVVINKVDRDSSRVQEVESEVFDLFIALNATEEQLDFPYLYASGREGWCVAERNGDRSKGMEALMQAILKYVPAPPGKRDDPFAMTVSMIAHDRYVGRLLQGRIRSGSVSVGDSIHALRFVGENGKESKIVDTGRITKVTVQRGTTSVETATAYAGNIVQIAGLGTATVADTVCVPTILTALHAAPVDPPTVSMTFGPNDSPFQGKEGSKLTSQAIAERLQTEVQSNVSISLKATTTEAIEVMGRGEMQLGVLIETMRREGFEMSISPPKVLMREINGVLMEPLEEVIMEVEDESIGMVIDALTKRGGTMDAMNPSGNGRTRLRYLVPSRGLIGFKRIFKMDTRGSGIIYSTFHSYAKHVGGLERTRKGSLISSAQGMTTAYALNTLESRGTLFVGARIDTYVGMIVGEHNRSEDLDVNPTKAKQLTNMRASGTDEGIFLTPPRQFSLEEAIGYVLEDEMIEVTPKSIRMRKSVLDPSRRKKRT